MVLLRAKLCRARRSLRSSSIARGIAVFIIPFAVLATPVRADSIGDHTDNDDGEFGTFLLGAAAFAAGLAITSPVWAPMVAFERGEEGTFLQYPYENSDFGYMKFLTDDVHGKSWAGRVLSEYGADDDVDRVTTQLVLDSWFRVGCDAEWNYFGGRFQDRPGKEFQTGDANLLVRFAQNPHVQFHLGIGTRWLDDSASTQYGFNFTYGADVQWIRPFVASAAIDWGEIHDEEFFHGRVSLGAIWRRWEAYAAFDYLEVDQSQFGGPMVGVRAWF